MSRITLPGSVWIGWTLLAAASALLLGCGSARHAEGHPTALPSAPSDEAIAALLAERMARNGVGIVVGVIADHRRSVVSHGLRAAGTDHAVNGSTVFQIGSLTKVITSLLLADMVARGEVRLDDPVSLFLPGKVTLVELGRPVTLRDLATHTSGLPSMPTNFDLQAGPNPYTAYPVDSLWSFLSTFRPNRAPGTAYEYSNLGVSLLGHALALRHATSYEKLVTVRVLTPLGMSNTSVTVTEAQLGHLAFGHGPDLERVDEWEMTTLQASGSLRSTADDMMKLLEALLGRAEDPYIREAVAIQLREGVRVDETFRPLGLGLRGDGIYSHAGGKEGYRSGLAFNPRTGVGAVVLANTRTYGAEPMAIALHLVGGDPLDEASVAAEPKTRAQVASADLLRFAGKYRRADGQEYEVVVAGERLRIRYPNHSIFEFIRSGEYDFFYRAGDDDITFHVDTEGQVSGMTIFGDGRREGDGRLAERIRASGG